MSTRKLITATAVCALAVGLTAAPGALAKSSTKQVPSTVSVTASGVPTTIPVTASGNVQATSRCRKDRTVRFAYVNIATLAETAIATTATTGPNGDFTATFAPPAEPGAYTLRATVDETLRTKTVKGKKKGASKGKKKGNLRKRKFNCLSGTGSSGTFTVRPDP